MKLSVNLWVSHLFYKKKLFTHFYEVDLILHPNTYSGFLELVGDLFGSVYQRPLAS